MNATFTETHTDPRTGRREVFVYVRGRLVMKRRSHTGVSVLFQVAPSFTYSNRDAQKGRDR